jgi:nicotinamidase-related amidase
MRGDGSENRHPALADAKDSVLVVIDPQVKLVNMISERESVLERIVQLVKFAPVYGLPVILTEHYPRGLGPTVERVKEALPRYSPLEKRIFSCFGLPAFHEALLAAGRRRLLITGVETHICVCQTVLDGLQRGFTVHVVADAVGSRRSLDHEIALRKMEQAGAVVTTAEAAMYEVAERADDAKFKELLNLVK